MIKPTRLYWFLPCNRLISRKYAHGPSPVEPPVPTAVPALLSLQLGWAALASRQLPTSCLFHPWQRMRVDMPLSHRPASSCLHCNQQVREHSPCPLHSPAPDGFISTSLSVFHTRVIIHFYFSPSDLPLLCTTGLRFISSSQNLISFIPFYGMKCICIYFYHNVFIPSIRQRTSRRSMSQLL